MIMTWTGIFVNNSDPYWRPLPPHGYKSTVFKMQISIGNQTKLKLSSHDLSLLGYPIIFIIIMTEG